jgi:hypothetical protein
LESGDLGCGVPGPDRQMDMYRHANESKKIKVMPGKGGLDASREKYSTGVGHEERQPAITGKGEFADMAGFIEMMDSLLMMG